MLVAAFLLHMRGKADARSQRREAKQSQDGYQSLPHKKPVKQAIFRHITKGDISRIRPYSNLCRPIWQARDAYTNCTR